MALPTFQGALFSDPGLYSFSSHTFTNCGATGRTGPTLANCKSSYDTVWEGDTDFFNVQTQGIQEWTVPSTGTYRIEAYGAEGGNGSGSSTGGLGARMRGDFSLTNGEVIKIMVGQQGGGDGNSVGGGGGASCSCSTGGGGGGGGYSGGGGGGPQNYGSYSFGGGGGSYNAGSNTSNSSGARSGHGQVIITRI